LNEAGIITADYQNYLEKEWIRDLRVKYQVVVNRECSCKNHTNPPSDHALAHMLFILSTHFRSGFFKKKTEGRLHGLW